jgi:hypothetical protein
MQKRLYLILALLVPAGVSAQASQSGAAQPGAAPAPQKATLSLDEAINLARRNNPVHLAVVNNRRTADSAVRSANGQLLPNADASFQAQRQQGGRQIFGGTSLGASSDINQSQYSIGIGYRINRATLIAPKLERASRDAVEADIAGSAELRARLREHLGDRLVRDVVIGVTHQEQGGAGLSASGTTFFFAPNQMRKRTGDWGRPELDRRFAEAWLRFAPTAEKWVDVVRHVGPEALRAVWLEVLSGATSPRRRARWCSATSSWSSSSTRRRPRRSARSRS